MTSHPHHEFDPRSGTVWHETGFIGEYNAAGVWERDAIMEARFHNPYDTARGDWSYGFMFRKYEQNRFYIVVVSSDKYWDLRARLIGDGDDDQELGSGYFPHIRTGETESNLIRVEAEGNVGNLYVNGQHVAELDLSAISRAGEISIATNFFREDGIPGEPTSTRFENFTVSMPVAPVGPQPTAVPAPTATPRPTPPVQVSTPTPKFEGLRNYDERISGAALDAADEAWSLLQAGDHEEAIQRYTRALELHGRPSAVIEHDIGFAYSLLGEHLLAVRHYTRSLQISESSLTQAARAGAHRHLGQCDLAKQDALTALKLPEERGRTVSAHQNAHVILSNCYESEGNIPQAIRHLTEATEIGSDLPENTSNTYILSYLSGLHYENGDCVQAQDAAIRALATPIRGEPGWNNHAEAHLYMALCLGESERWSEVLTHVESALTLATESGYSAEDIESIESWIEDLKALLSE